MADRIVDGRPGGAAAPPGGPGVPAGLKKPNALADLWHRHPWLVATGAGAALVGAWVFYQKNFAGKKKPASSTSGGGSHLRPSVLHTGGGIPHDPHQHHKHVHGGGADVQASGDQAGPDEMMLSAQIGDLQDSLESYTLARTRGVSPGGPNPGPEAPGMGTKNTSAEIPNPAAVPMP